METNIIKVRGTNIIGYPFASEIGLINSIKPRIKKYKFAIFLNYNIRFNGKKVKKLYFEVLTSLFGYLFFLTEQHKHFLSRILLLLTRISRVSVDSSSDFWLYISSSFTLSLVELKADVASD